MDLPTIWSQQNTILPCPQKTIPVPQGKHRTTTPLMFIAKKVYSPPWGSSWGHHSWGPRPKMSISAPTALQCFQRCQEEERAPAMQGILLINRNCSDGSAQPAGGCVEPTVKVSQCVGRRKGGLSTPGGWLSFTQRTPCTTTRFVPPSPGLGLHGAFHQFPSSRQDSKTLSRSSEKHHYFVLICCSLCPPGEQGG